MSALINQSILLALSGFISISKGVACYLCQGIFIVVRWTENADKVRVGGRIRVGER